MSVLECNGTPVLRARIVMPRVGAWTGAMTVDTETPLDGGAELVSHGDVLRLQGTVTRGGVAGDTLAVRVVAGKGELRTEVEAQSYRLLPLRVVLMDVLSLAGETLSPLSDEGILDTILPSWTRAATTASRAITSLVESVDATWRVLSDGTIWVGKETWPAADPFVYAVLDEAPEDDRIVLGVEAPALIPGTLFRGRRVSLVVHTIDDDGVRSEVWFERDTEPSRLLGAFRRLVEKIFWRVDFLALYPARVVGQNSDGTLELQADSPRLPGISRVPIRAGLPGLRLTVTAGARVLIGFEEGDPRRPRAMLWDEPGLVEIQIGGARPVARQGDQVTLTLPPVLPIAGTSATLGAFVGTIQIPTPLIGTIITGSGILKA